MALIAASTTERDLLAGVLWTVGYTTGIMTALIGTTKFGIRIGSKDVIYQARTYGGTVTDVEVQLYQDPWTGGTSVSAANRNLKIALPGPVTYASGVTGTLTTFRTGLKLYSTGVGNGSLGGVPEGEWYLLAANTDYILNIVNVGAVDGLLNFRWTYRAVD